VTEGPVGVRGGKHDKLRAGGHRVASKQWPTDEGRKPIGHRDRALSHFLNSKEIYQAPLQLQCITIFLPYLQTVNQN